MKHAFPCLRALAAFVAVFILLPVGTALAAESGGVAPPPEPGVFLSIWLWVVDFWDQLGFIAKSALVALGIWPILMFLLAPLMTFLSLGFTTLMSYMGVAYLIKVIANSSIYGILRGWFESWASKLSDRHSRELPQRDIKFRPTVKNFRKMRLEESERSTAFADLLSQMEDGAKKALAAHLGRFVQQLKARSDLLSQISVLIDAFDVASAEADKAFEAERQQYGFIRRFYKTFRHNRLQKKRETQFLKAGGELIAAYQEVEADLVKAHDDLHARAAALKVAQAAEAYLKQVTPEVGQTA